MKGTEMRKIVFFGDSNTYGYEPSEVMPGRYPAEVRWVDRLAGQLGEEWQVISNGLNGRKIPDVRHSYQQEPVLRMIKEAEEAGILAVMLGTNDILLTYTVDAEVPVTKMDRFLAFVTERMDPQRLLLIAPAYIGSSSENIPFLSECYEESIRMNEGFRTLSAKYGNRFVDAGKWGIELAYDHVHFSPSGHRQFAEHMKIYIQGLTMSSISAKSITSSPS